MTLGVLSETERLPRRGRRLIPAGVPRRGEVLAVFAVTIVAGHLVFAPVTLVVLILLAAAGKASRWRLWWLLLPAATGLAWVLALGPGTALAGFTAWPSGILDSLHGRLAGHPAAHPGHPSVTLRVAWSSLPAQLPIALICGAAEAAMLGWLVWLHTDEWAVRPPRSGALAAVRGRLAGAAIRAGAVLTRDGCALGVASATGAIAELRWAEMAGGLLITGDDPRDVTLASLQVVHAALRRRKPLIVFDHGEGSAIGRALTAACQATGTPLRMNGSAAGAGAADGTDTAGGTGGASASRLWGRAREGRTENSHAVRTAAGTHIRTAVRTAIDPHQVILERSAALLPADSPETAARACADLTALAQHLRAISVDSDGLVWIPRGELVPAGDLATLLRDAPAAGLPVLIGATSSTAAADLAGLAGATLTVRVTDPGLASRLAELTGIRLLPAPAAAAFAGAALAGVAGAEAGSWSPPGMPAVPPPPAMGVPPARAVPPAMTMPTAALAQSAAPAQPGVRPMPGTDLVPCPVIPPRVLHALRRGEFVLAVSVPRRRLVALGRLVPARLPQRAEPSQREEPPYRKAPPYREAPSQREAPLYRKAPPYREAPPRQTAPEVAGR